MHYDLNDYYNLEESRPGLVWPTSCDGILIDWVEFNILSAGWRLFEKAMHIKGTGKAVCGSSSRGSTQEVTSADSNSE